MVYVDDCKVHQMAGARELDCYGAYGLKLGNVSLTGLWIANTLQSQNYNTRHNQPAHSIYLASTDATPFQAVNQQLALSRAGHQKIS